MSVLTLWIPYLMHLVLMFLNPRGTNYTIKKVASTLQKNEKGGQNTGSFVEFWNRLN